MPLSPALASPKFEKCKYAFPPSYQMPKSEMDLGRELLEFHKRWYCHKEILWEVKAKEAWAPEVPRIVWEASQANQMSSALLSFLSSHCFVPHVLLYLFHLFSKWPTLCWVFRPTAASWDPHIPHINAQLQHLTETVSKMLCDWKWLIILWQLRNKQDLQKDTQQC